MSVSKALIAAPHAIGAAMILSLVVPEGPTDVFINEAKVEVQYSPGPHTTREI